jgi:protein phosphatase 1 regulatory subunit 7
VYRSWQSLCFRNVIIARVDLANNKIKVMAGLKGLTQLKKLDLGANRIREMNSEELSGLINLEELWLGKNKIEMIEGLENLTKIRRLDVQSNRLTTIENLGSQRATLEELYLSHNAITTEGAMIPTGLAQEFPQLSVLDMSRNKLTACDPFGHLTALEELWISGNEIVSFDDIQSLSNLKLETVYLEYNPLQSDPLYRKRLAELVPSLTQIDAYLIAGYEASRGGAALYVSPRAVGTGEEALRRMQDMAITRAHNETHGEPASDQPAQSGP